MTARVPFLHQPDAAAGAKRVRSRAWDDGRSSSADETIADEVPIAIAYNGMPHAVMLATPNDLEEFGVGFSLSEGIVESADEILDCDVKPAPRGIKVGLRIRSEHAAAVRQRRRTLTGRTGCGLCGTQSLDQVFRNSSRVRPGFELDAGALHRALVTLQRSQPLHALTGAVHAAGWGRADGTVALVREDVGRHNALDKLIGAMVAQRLAFDDGFALMTSRASSEIVQKAAVVGIPMVAAISAPTALAIDLAEQGGVTLVAFLRHARHTVYAHPERVRTAAGVIA